MDFDEALWNLLDNSYRKGDVENYQLLMAVDIFNLQAPCVLYTGQAFRYCPENAFYIFDQQIYFII